MTLSRRRFLGNAAGMVALPLLESLVPRSARAQTLTPPRRLIYYYLPNGRVPDTWVPSASGAGFDFPPALAPLQPYASNLTMVSALTNMGSSSAVSKPGCDHCRSAGPVLTSAAMPDTANSATNGISVDQAIAQALNPPTPFASLQWSSAQPGVGDCGSSTTYTQSISWADTHTPLAPITNVTTAFNQLFAGSDPSASAAQKAQRMAQSKSVLDFVQSDAKTVTRQLSAADQQKLDEYFTGVRALETRLTAPYGANCQPGSAPLAGVDFPTTVQAWNDLIVLALQCDMSRLLTFMLEFELSYCTYDFLFPGVSTQGHHSLSHYSNTNDYNQLVAVETWQTKQIAYLVQKLKSTPEGSGTLFDSVALVGLPGMGLGNTHDHANISPVVLGSCGGRLKGGQHLATGGAPLANLHISLMAAMGVKVSSFGLDGNGTIAGLQ